MNNFKNIPFKLKVALGILLSLLLATILIIILRPKKNNIPVLPKAVKLDLHQNVDKSLTLKNISLVENYAPDYQADLLDNYYEMKILKKDELLFMGKTPASYVKIQETYNAEGTDMKPHIDERLLGDFTLYVPYYRDGEVLHFYNEEGKNLLSINLKTLPPSIPVTKNFCGDGICSDNENILMCTKDCKTLLWTSFK